MPKDSKTPKPRTPRVTANLANKALAYSSASWTTHQTGTYPEQVGKSLALWKIATRQNPDQLAKWARKQEPQLVQAKIEQVAKKLNLTEARRFIFISHIRSHLDNYGGVILPKNHNQYITKVFHRGYTKSEIQKLLGKLPDDLHKLYVTIAAETGLRARKILTIKIGQILTQLPEEPEYNLTYPHIQFEPKDYLGRKRVGYTYISNKIMKEIQRLQEKGVISKETNKPLIKRAYISIYQAILRSKTQNQLDPKISTIHGFRDYYEKALDKVEPPIDSALKARLTGRSLGPKTDASGYTTRDIPTLQNIYQRAYPWIDIDNNAPTAINALQQQYDSLKQEHDKLQQQTNVLAEAALKTALKKASQQSNIPAEEILSIIKTQIENLPIDTKLRLFTSELTQQDIDTMLNNLRQTAEPIVIKALQKLRDTSHQ